MESCAATHSVNVAIFYVLDMRGTIWFCTTIMYCLNGPFASCYCIASLCDTVISVLWFIMVTWYSKCVKFPHGVRCGLGFGLSKFECRASF